MVVERGVVGIVGLGQMGAPMARVLAGAGWRVVGWDVVPANVEAVAGDGVEVASDVAAVARSVPVVLTSLPDAAAVRAVALGEGGLTSAGHHTGLLVVDATTTTPSDARTLAAELATHGVDFLDAPVTGGPAGAAAGRLGIMVGGDEALVARARPILDAIGSTVVHCGPVGSGQVVKACNQLIVVSALGAVAEALTLAEAAGVDPWQVREVLLSGYAYSPILENQGARMLKRDFVPGGKARLNMKDAVTMAELSRETGVALPVFEAAAGYIRALAAAGGADLDHSAVITVVERGQGSTGG